MGYTERTNEMIKWRNEKRIKTEDEVENNSEEIEINRLANKIY